VTSCWPFLLPHLPSWIKTWYGLSVSLHRQILFEHHIDYIYFPLPCPNLEIGTHAYFMLCMGDSGTSVWRLALSQSSRRPSHARWCTIIMQDQLVQVYLVRILGWEWDAVNLLSELRPDYAATVRTGQYIPAHGAAACLVV
jgi:hypothetical protein